MVRNLCIACLSLLTVLAASAAYAQGGLFSFSREEDSVAVQRLVERYLRFTDGEPMPVDSIESYAVDELQTRLKKTFGVPLRYPASMPATYLGARATRADGRTAIAVMSVRSDSLPGFGVLSVEWVFFARRTDKKPWRLFAIRRQNKVENAMAELRYLDSSSMFPPSLKPVVARETGSILLSNAQLRSNFAANRASFAQLAGHFLRPDSLFMLARIDRVIAQVNLTSIVWGDAAQEIPPAAREELMAKLTAEQRAAFENQLRGVDVIRRKAMDSLAAIAGRLRFSMSRLDSAVNIMHDLRIAFVNARLPWKNAVQFTVAGVKDDVLGYLYAPAGQVPFISEEEYFYLEDLGDGWWIFRAT